MEIKKEFHRCANCGNMWEKETPTSDNSDYVSAVKDLNKWFDYYCVVDDENIANEQLKCIIDRLNASHFT